MQWDVGKKTTIYLNTFTFTNWAFGIDSYVVFEDSDCKIDVAKVTMLNFLFFNLTVTRWRKPF